MAKTLAQILAGEDMEGGELFCDDIYNNLKNHWYGNTAPASPVNGMIWHKDDGTVSIYFGGTWYQFYNEFTTVTHKWLKGADKPSVAALDISALDGNYFDVTGVAAITSITTSGRVGTVIRLHFDGILTLTHHAVDLILPGAANITTAAGDEATFIEYAAGDWRCVCYTKADGTPVVASGGDKIEEGNSSVEVIDPGVGYIETKADAQLVRRDSVLGNTQPLQPCFLAYNSVTDANETGDGTLYTLDFDSEVFDQGGNFAGGTFTAPITGRYLLTFYVRVEGVVAHNTSYTSITTSNRIYIDNDVNPGAIKGPDFLYFKQTVIADMDADDTAVAKISVGGGAKVVDLTGAAAGTLYTHFAGALIC